MDNKELTSANYWSEFLEAKKSEIEKVMSKSIGIEKLTKLILGEFRKNPKLMECSKASIFDGIMRAAQDGLELGIDAHLLPYKGKATYIPNYKGLLKLIRRSKEVGTINVQLVYEKDEFEIYLGTETKVLHKPFIGSDRGPIIGAYCVAEIKGAGYQIEFMTDEQLNAIKKRSPSADFSSSPWKTDEPEMKRKTVLRRASKYLPMSVEVARTLQEADEAEFSGSIIEHEEQPKIIWKGAQVSEQSAKLNEMFSPKVEGEKEQEVLI